MQYLTLILFYLSIHTISIAAPIKGFNAHYDLYYNDMYIGKTRRHLINNNNILTFSSIAKTDGIAAWFKDITIFETSKLHYKNNQLNFVSYDYDEVKNKEKSIYKLHIDKKIKFTIHIPKNIILLSIIYMTCLVLQLQLCKI